MFQKWWRLPELNWGHADFQSAALPTELSRRKKLKHEVYGNATFRQPNLLVKMGGGATGLLRPSGLLLRNSLARELASNQLRRFSPSRLTFFSKNIWSARLDGNANRFSARFINQVSLLDGNAKSESLFRTPIGTELDGNVNFFAKSSLSNQLVLKFVANLSPPQPQLCKNKKSAFHRTYGDAFLIKELGVKIHFVIPLD